MQEQILKPIFMKLTKKDIKTKPGILHYTPQSNKALCCRFCLMLAFMLGLCTISFAQKAKVTITGMVYDKKFSYSAFRWYGVFA